jgi:hypothetical protein
MKNSHAGELEEWRIGEKKYWVLNEKRPAIESIWTDQRSAKAVLVIGGTDQRE